jgi:hypothetical protein
MRENEKVRFRSDDIFEEAAPPEDRSRPLEWRRSFNSLAVTATRPIVSYAYGVNDRNFIWEKPAAGEPIPPSISPKTQRRVQIVMLFDKDDCKDKVLKAVETEKKSGIYELEAYQARTKLVLVGQEPSEANDVYADGAYRGYACFDDMADEKEHLYVELSCPPAFVDELASELKRDPSLNLRVYFSLQSFTFEVDDALREWYHPQEMFIKGMVPAALIHVATVAPEEAEDVNEEEQRGAGSIAGRPFSAKLENLPRQTPTVSLRGINFALWVIAAALVLQWVGST